MGQYANFGILCAREGEFCHHSGRVCAPHCERFSWGCRRSWRLVYKKVNSCGKELFEASHNRYS